MTTWDVSFPTDTIVREEAVTDENGNALFIVSVSSTTTRQVLENGADSADRRI